MPDEERKKKSSRKSKSLKEDHKHKISKKGSSSKSKTLLEARVSARQMAASSTTMLVEKPSPAAPASPNQQPVSVFVAEECSMFALRLFFFLAEKDRAYVPAPVPEPEWCVA